MNKENILEIDNLERSYSTVMPDGETKVYSVLRGISFQVKRGEFIGIMEKCSITAKIQQKFMEIIWQKYAGRNWRLFFRIFT